VRCVCGSEEVAIENNNSLFVSTIILIRSSSHKFASLLLANQSIETLFLFNLFRHPTQQPGFERFSRIIYISFYLRVELYLLKVTSSL
jgi:hypothetical protein